MMFWNWDTTLLRIITVTQQYRIFSILRQCIYESCLITYSCLLIWLTKTILGVKFRLLSMITWRYFMRCLVSYLIFAMDLNFLGNLMISQLFSMKMTIGHSAIILMSRSKCFCRLLRHLLCSFRNFLDSGRTCISWMIRLKI